MPDAPTDIDRILDITETLAKSIDHLTILAQKLGDSIIIAHTRLNILETKVQDIIDAHSR